jgi:hypothetical protein
MINDPHIGSFAWFELDRVRAQSEVSRKSEYPVFQIGWSNFDRFSLR